MNKISQNLLTKYIINLNNVYENKVLKEKISFIIKRAE